MENLILLLSFFCFIVLLYLLIRYCTKETMANVIGLAVASALICVFQIIGFIVADLDVRYPINALIYFILFLLSISEIPRIRK